MGLASNGNTKRAGVTLGDKGTLGLQMFAWMTDGAGAAEGEMAGLLRQLCATCTPLQLPVYLHNTPTGCGMVRRALLLIHFMCVYVCGVCVYVYRMTQHL